MFFHSYPSKEAEFKVLLSQNEESYKIRKTNLMKDVEKLRGFSDEVALLSSIRLTEALAFMSNVAETKKETEEFKDYDDEGIDLEIEDDVKKEIANLNDEIEILDEELEIMNQSKNKYQIAQKLITKQILDIEEVILNNPFQIQLPSINKTNEIGPDLSFVYEKSTDGSICFKNDYKIIVNHYFKRLEENKCIIDRLEKLVLEKVVQQEAQLTKIEDIKSIEIQLGETQENYSRIKSEIESSKQKLKLILQEKYEEIENRLPEEIDRGVKEFVTKNISYQNTYRKLLEIVKNVISDTNISTVSSNLSRS